MKQIFSILLFILSLNSYAQVVDASQTFKIEGDSLKIMQLVKFSFGSGELCPKIKNYTFNKTNNTELKLDILYNTTGAWPSHYCEQIDSITYPLDSLPLNLEMIIVNTNTNNSWLNDSISIRDTDTFYYQFINTMELSKNSTVINPVQNTLVIKTENYQIENIEILDINGRLIYKGKYQENIDVSYLSKGFYVVKIYNKNYRAIKKIYKE